MENNFAEASNRMRAELAPARILALTEDISREKELAELYMEAREELSRLKVANRALVAEVAGNPLSLGRKNS